MANLQNADLNCAHLNGADLAGSNLLHVDLRGADLRLANLTGAQLRDADLYRAQLDGADLTDANLYGARLPGACLRWTKPSRAQLQSAADLTDAELGPNPTTVPEGYDVVDFDTGQIRPKNHEDQSTGS
jgi:uncharacterized protein YjbI with pentapeptide repeats